MTEKPLLPVHVQRDEDAALGAAWRRCEAATRKWGAGHSLSLATSDDPPGYIVDAIGTLALYDPTAAGALEAFAVRLEMWMAE